MDVIDLIKDDHQEICDQLEKIAATGDDQLEEREALFLEMREMMSAHLNAEERSLYQAVEDLDDLEGQILDSYEEHKDILAGLQSLSELEVNDEDWLQKFQVLRENFLSHIAEEENSLLPVVQDLVGDEGREEMADDMKSLEDEIISAGPVLVTQTPAQTIVETNT